MLAASLAFPHVAITLVKVVRPHHGTQCMADGRYRAKDHASTGSPMWLQLDGGQPLVVGVLTFALDQNGNNVTGEQCRHCYAAVLAAL